MPSSYTPRSRLTKQATGENTNTWGLILNAGVFELVDFLADGVVTISASGPTTLSTANGATDQARGRVLNVTATGPVTITIPSVEKTYLVRAATAAVTITNEASSVTIPAGDIAWVVTDGATIWQALSTDFKGRRLTNVGAPNTNADAATKKYVDDTAFGSTIPNFPGLTGNDGKALTADEPGDTVAWVEPIRSVTRLTANHLARHRERLGCDTNGGGFTVTLPASPDEGDRVVIFDIGNVEGGTGFGGNPITVDRNGSTICDVADDMLLTTRGLSVAFEYSDATWRIHRGD